MTLKSLKGKERWAFIWDYYKIHIIAAVILIVAAAYTVNVMVFNRPNGDYLSIAYYGNNPQKYYAVDPPEIRTVYIDVENRLLPIDYEYRSVDIREYISDALNDMDIQTGRKDRKVSGYSFNAKSNHDTAILSSKMLLGELDIIIMQDVCLDSMIDVLKSCDKYLPYEFLNKFSGNLYTADNQSIYGIVIDNDNKYFGNLFVNNQNGDFVNANFVITVPASASDEKSGRVLKFIENIMGR